MRRIDPLPNVQLGTVADHASGLRAGTVDTALTRRLGILLHDTEPDDRAIAELGTWNGGTAAQCAGFLGNRGELHLFDYDDVVAPVAAQLRDCGIRNVTA